MTLANFNSNFNWQLRALQRAAECCTTEIGPVSTEKCYFYGKVNDPYCASFSALAQEWDLNGSPPYAWSGLMINPPYGTEGNAYQFTEPGNPCGSYSYSSFYFWTMLPSYEVAPPLTGFDSYGVPITVSMLGPICGTKCYEGMFNLPFSPFAYGFNTPEISTTDYSISVDLSSPTASTDLTNQLRFYYPAPLTATVLYNTLGFGEVIIRIDGVYSTGGTFNILMDDGFTVGTLNEVPCL
jgi:hypothetical protein